MMAGGHFAEFCKAARNLRRCRCEGGDTCAACPPNEGSNGTDQSLHPGEDSTGGGSAGEGSQPRRSLFCHRWRAAKLMREGFEYDESKCCCDR